MKIGLFTNAYLPLLNGVVNSLHEIRNGLKRCGHTPYVFAPEVKGYRDTASDIYRFASLEMTNKIAYPIPIPYSNKLFRLIKKLDLDLIHAHHPFLLGDVAAHFARQKQVPLVYTFHTQMEHYSHYVPLNQQVVLGMMRSSIARFLNKCDLIIAPSVSVRGLIDSYGVSSKVVTLANAIDTSRFTTSKYSKLESRKVLGLPVKATISLSVGRLSKEKNLDFMLESMARLPNQKDQLLVMVGEGHQASALQSLAKKLGIADRIVFTGPVASAKMPLFYAASDLFVISSTTEVKPLVVLEALASGRPVLAVAACGTTDTIHHGVDGWLSSASVDEFSKGWALLLSNTSFREQLAVAAATTAEAYSLDRYLKKLVDIYCMCIDTHHHGLKKYTHF